MDNRNISGSFPPKGGLRGAFSSERGFIRGFSKLNREQRIELLQQWLGEDVAKELDSFLHTNPEIQSSFSELTENYLSNYILPFGVVPNVMVNDELYLVPFVIEESSVVAAASRAAGFWAQNGGFKSVVLSTQKKGQVHFKWTGTSEFLFQHFPLLKKQLLQANKEVSEAMRNRGGGITAIDLVDLTDQMEHYFQLDAFFETVNAMGANFINTCLENMAGVLSEFLSNLSSEGNFEIIMSILSNYTPESIVKCTVECEIEQLKSMSGEYLPFEFAQRFKSAVDMANANVSRAVTHNKGIYNGIDGVILATGNDWRAVEAAGHAFAARNGHYQSLSEVEISGNVFHYSLTVPLAIGTVGGMTKNHPLSQFALKMLRNPSASKLMEITAALGMASNFSAIASLVTSGIQKGHMKMHLNNILNQLGASADQKEKAMSWFADKTVSYSAVKNFINNNLRNDSVETPQ